MRISLKFQRLYHRFSLTVGHSKGCFVQNLRSNCQWILNGKLRTYYCDCSFDTYTIAWQIQSCDIVSVGHYFLSDGYSEYFGSNRNSVRCVLSLKKRKKIGTIFITKYWPGENVINCTWIKVKTIAIFRCNGLNHITRTTIRIGKKRTEKL